MTRTMDCVAGRTDGNGRRARIATRLGWALAAVGLMMMPLADAASAQAGKFSDGKVKIGILTDLNGPYSDITGSGMVVAAQMAIEDAGKAIDGAPIELLVADHANKPDLASATARKWIDEEGLDAFAEVSASSPALAVLDVAKAKNRIIMFSAPGTTRLTNADCSAVSVQWVYDSYSNAAGTAGAIMKKGGDTWYFITSDNAFGTALQTDVTAAVTAGGGTVAGSIRQPLGTLDFSNAILQAQGSGAKVIAFANGGADLVNSMKAAQEFGLSGKTTIASLVVLLNDVHAMGLATAQNLVLTSGWYWDLNDDTRAFAKRFLERHKAMPNALQAGVYSAVRHYLQAVKDSGTDDTATVMAKMKATKVNDMFAKGGYIREDGRMMHDMHLMQVKTPAESKYPWDYFKLLATIPAEQAFQPLSKSTCPLVHK